MANFERIGLVFQVIQNVHGLMRNMRDNANGYKAQVIAGRPINQIAAVMVADAQQYVIRIGWVTALATRNLTLLTNALTDLGLTITEANSLKATLLTAANHTIAASLTTGTEINTEADAILAAVPNMERIF